MQIHLGAPKQACILGLWCRAESQPSNGFNQQMGRTMGRVFHISSYLSAPLLQPGKASMGLHLPLVTSCRLSLHQLHGTSPKEPPARAEVPSSSSGCHVLGCPCPTELGGSKEQALSRRCKADGNAASCSRRGKGPSRPAANPTLGLCMRGSVCKPSLRR